MLEYWTIKKLLKEKAIIHSFLGVYTYKDLKKLKQNIKNKNYSPKIGKKEIKLDKKELMNLNYKNEYLKNRYKIKIFYKH